MAPLRLVAERRRRSSTGAYPGTADLQSGTGVPARSDAMILAAPVEGERRDHHPAMPHRHQVRLPGGVLLLQQRDRSARFMAGRRPSGPMVVSRRERSAEASPHRNEPARSVHLGRSHDYRCSYVSSPRLVVAGLSASPVPHRAAPGLGTFRRGPFSSQMGDAAWHPRTRAWGQRWYRWRLSWRGAALWQRLSGGPQSKEVVVVWHPISSGGTGSLGSATRSRSSW